MTTLGRLFRRENWTCPSKSAHARAGRADVEDGGFPATVGSPSRWAPATVEKIAINAVMVVVCPNICLWSPPWRRDRTTLSHGVRQQRVRGTRVVD
jgi:hypothetical protein